MFKQCWRYNKIHPIWNFLRLDTCIPFQFQLWMEEKVLLLSGIIQLLDKSLVLKQKDDNICVSLIKMGNLCVGPALGPRSDHGKGSGQAEGRHDQVLLVLLLPQLRVQRLAEFV